MHLVHDQFIDAPLDQVWAGFTDLRRIGSCFPGAAVTEVDGDDFVGAVKVKLGPVVLTYDGAGSMLTRDESRHHAVIQAAGAERHGLGRATINIAVTLTPSGGGTQAALRTDLVVKGSPTNLGGGVAQRVSDPLIERFLTCMGSNGCTGGVEDEPLDLARSVLPSLARSYGRSLSQRLRRR